jgi:hypothetical protein
LSAVIILSECIRQSRIAFLLLVLKLGKWVVVVIVFFHCLAPLVGMTVPELRRCLAYVVRDNEQIYGGLGDFELYGGYQAYCDLVATCGIYVEEMLKSLPPLTLFRGIS